MTGLFLALALGSAWVLANTWPPYAWAAIIQTFVWGLGLVGLLSSSVGIRLGPVTKLGVFLWASLAMLVGCLVAAGGGAQVAYSSAEPSQS